MYAPPLTQDTNTTMNALAFLWQKWSAWPYLQVLSTSTSHHSILPSWLLNQEHSPSSLYNLNQK